MDAYIFRMKKKQLKKPIVPVRMKNENAIKLMYEKYKNVAIALLVSIFV